MPSGGQGDRKCWLSRTAVCSFREHDPGECQRYSLSRKQYDRAEFLGSGVRDKMGRESLERMTGEGGRTRENSNPTDRRYDGAGGGE